MPLPVPATLAPLLIIALLAIVSAGCTAPAQPAGTDTVLLSSTPPGAEIYFDNEYRGTTPATIAAATAGSHVVEVRMDGYESWSGTVTVVTGGSVPVTARLVAIPVAVSLPVTPATTAVPVAAVGKPEIYVDGYWTFVEGRESTTNPVPLLVHTEAFNTGNTSARGVTVSANFWYHGRMVCWNTVYLGMLAAGGHDAKDTLVTCTLPSGFSSSDLTVTFENPAWTG